MLAKLTRLWLYLCSIDWIGQEEAARAESEQEWLDRQTGGW
jgi:hypothetical protein